MQRSLWTKSNATDFRDICAAKKENIFAEPRSGVFSKIENARCTIFERSEWKIMLQFVDYTRKPSFQKRRTWHPWEMPYEMLSRVAFWFPFVVPLLLPYCWGWTCHSKPKWCARSDVARRAPFPHFRTLSSLGREGSLCQDTIFNYRTTGYCYKCVILQMLEKKFRQSEHAWFFKTNVQ